MEKIEWDDVQGLLLSGYPMLPVSAYLLWRFLPGENTAAKKWIGNLAERVTRAETENTDSHEDTGSREAASRSLNLYMLKKMAKQDGGDDMSAVNLALTASALQFLEIGEGALENFSLEFQEGMAPRPEVANGTPRRSNVLGDLGESSPANWNWGGWNKNGRVDGLLLLYAADRDALDRLVTSELAALDGIAEPVIAPTAETRGLPILEGYIYDDLREHFGFKDGLSQPVIEGSPKAKRMAVAPKRGEGGDADQISAKEQRIVLVKPGEFIMGYPNERNAIATDAVATSIRGAGRSADLRRNGTYLVFRQLEQDVAAFNRFVSDAATQVYGNADQPARDQLAARLVGRQFNGDPLVHNNAPGKSTQNDFLYFYEDRAGMNCPIGAHIRRANPRDTVGPDPDTALRLSKMHRILRRGRPYGEKFDPSREPKDDKASRGMLFIALNADIAGQFEMIQHSWLNNPRFGGMRAGVDPFGHLEHEGDVIVVQDRPANVYLERPKPFVRMRGGAYFFLPGIEAMRVLANR